VSGESVVLYALPELDGAIDPVPSRLGGRRHLSNSERVQRLIGRLKRWIALRQTPPAQRRIAVYGFLVLALQEQLPC